MLQSEEYKIQYNGNGSLVSFTFPFIILEASHLKVITTVVATGVDTVHTLDSTYSVFNVGTTSGFITFSTAPATGVRITLKRDVPLTQETDYEEHDRFPAATHERALDKLTMIDQQLNEKLSRTLMLAENTDLTDLPFPSPGAGQYIRWNEFGTELEVSTPTATPSGLPAGANYQALTINGSGTVEWASQIYHYGNNYVNAARYSTFNAAVSAIGANEATLVIASDLPVTVNVTVPHNCRLMFVGSGQLTPALGITVTINSPDQIFAAPANWIFDTTAGDVVFSIAGVIYVNWFGAKNDGTTQNVTYFQAAQDALPAGGGILQMLGGTYLINNTFSITKEKVTLRGQGMSTTKIVSTAVGVPSIALQGELVFDVLENFWLSGNTLTGASGCGHGIAMLDPSPDTGAYAPQQCIVRNVRVDGFRGTDSNGRGGTMRACGIAQVSTLENEIRNCRIDSNGIGVYIDTSFTPRVHDNIIIDNDQYGVLALGVTGVIENLFVKGNDILNNGDGTTTNQTGYTGAPTGNFYAYNLVGYDISGNKFKTGKNSNLIVTFSKGGLVAGNWIRADNQYGMISRCNNGLAIHGNSFDCTNGSPNAPRYLTIQAVGGKDTSGLDVRGNIFRFQGGITIDYCIKLEGDTNTRRFQASAIEHNYFGDVDISSSMIVSNAISVESIALTSSSISHNAFYAETNATISSCFTTDVSTSFVDFRFDRNSFHANGGTITARKTIAALTFPQVFYGTGSPEGVITAFIGSTYFRLDGGATTTLYVKTSGTGNTGWTAK